MYGRHSQSFGNDSSQFNENEDYNDYQKSSWRSGYEESPPGRGQGGGGREYGGSSRGRGSMQPRGQGRGLGSSRGRGSTSGFGRGSGGDTQSRGSGDSGGYGRGSFDSGGYGRGSGDTGGFGRGSSSSSQSRGSGGGGPNRGYSTGTGEWGGTTSGSGGSYAMSLLSRAQEMGLTGGEWSSSSGGTRGATEDQSMASSGDWNVDEAQSSGNYNTADSSGGWQVNSNRGGYGTGSTGGRELTLSAAVDQMSTGSWSYGSSRGRGTGSSRDRDTRQSEEWDSRPSRGRGTPRGRGASRGRERDTTDEREGGRMGGWQSVPSRGRGAGSSRGRDTIQALRDTVPAKSYGNRGAGYSSSRDVDCGGNRGRGSSERFEPGSESSRGGIGGRGYEREPPRESASITEKAMDILKAVLGPSGYNAENLTPDYPPNKRRRTDYEGEEDDHRRVPQSRNNRGRDESRWRSSSYNERFSEEGGEGRWGSQTKRRDREPEETRWGPTQSRNTRHNEDRGENQWGSQSHTEHHSGGGGRDYNQERYGPKSQSRNKDNFQYEQETHNDWRDGGRKQSQWGSQSRNERPSRESKTNRWESPSQREYHSEEPKKRWEEPKSYNEDYDNENDHQQWGQQRSYNDSADKRRKPLLGPYPDFEKPKPKSLLGPYPETEKPKPKPKPLLGPYPGHDKPKPKPLLGPYPGHDRSKPKSLLGPYPGHEQGGDEDYQWETPSSSSRGGMRGRGMRGGSRGSRGGRGARERHYVESYEHESLGYEEPQALLHSYEDEYHTEPYSHHEQIHDYQEGWYDDSEWGVYDVYEEGGGGEEYWTTSSSYGEPQSWEYDDLAWQYDDQHYGGGYEPQRLSVRERLGVKKPALLGAAPSVDLVKQLLTLEERERLCKKYGSLPLEALYCHMCNQSKFSSIDSYLMHQIGKKHVAMTCSFHAKSNTTYQLLKTNVQLALKRDRSMVNVPADGYCPICDVPKWGRYHHMTVNENLVLHRFVWSFCCNQRFSSRLQFENHRLSLKHLQNEYSKKQPAEERSKKRLNDLKEELKKEGLEEEVTKIEKEEQRIDKVYTINERIKERWTIMVTTMDILAKEKLPEKILKLKTLREINLRVNLRTKKPIKNSTQFVPYDPAEQVGVGNMIISTHYRCNLCSKSIDPEKESLIEHCKTEEHYKNAVLKKEELKKAKEAPKAKEGEEDTEKEGGNNNEEDAMEDDPMEDPYEGESGDINTLMNEVEEMIDEEEDKEDSEEGGDENLPEGYEDGDELIYDDGDIAEEFRDVLDYNPEDMEEELSYEEPEAGQKGAGKAAAASSSPSTGKVAVKKAKASPKKEKAVAKASTPVRRTRRK